MLGTIVNSITIIGGCLIGLLIKGKINDRLSQSIMNGLALCVIYIGISGVSEGGNILVTIISIAVGALIGEVIDIDKKLNNLGVQMESKLAKSEDSSIAQGFVTASLLFCVGAMAIIGSLQSGMNNNHDILFAKSVIDGISSIIFTAALGLGVMLSSVSVFLYQGIITIGAGFLADILSEGVISEMNICGSLLIIGLGLNVLKVTNIKIANLLPAVFIPILMGILNII